MKKLLEFLKKPPLWFLLVLAVIGNCRQKFYTDPIYKISTKHIGKSEFPKQGQQSAKIVKQ